ncbi:MAG: hypothetical protein PHW63_01955 [Alphaproteobacteria bacterium]|nr:hypothetical protein [Alphaproteobacteria bacterium]
MATKVKSLKLIYKIFIVCGIILFVGLYFVLFSPFPIPPKLCRDLPSSFVEADKVFQERIQKEFPEPVQEERFVDELQKQGFILFNDPTLSGVYFRKQSFPCSQKWSITWDKDANGSAINIQGSYQVVCL